MKRTLSFLTVSACLSVTACGKTDAKTLDLAKPCQNLSQTKPITIVGGAFQMGSESHYSDEGPIREVTLEPYKIDAFEVTQKRFEQFIQETGYVTVAERQPNPKSYPDIPKDKLVAGSAVFSMALGENTAGYWQFIPGANWKHPDGPNSTYAPKSNLPVNHIAYEDALAFANWAGGDLPTEAQWEYAARGGLDGATFEWGEVAPDKLDIPRANTWQGLFPAINKATDGYFAAAPVGCYEPNGYGLYDMTGNLWEWVKDSQTDANQGVIKGGSFLCAESYCRRYRPAARHSQEMDFSTNHIGFRVVYPVDNQN